MATTAGKRKRVPDEQGLPQKGALGYRLGNAVSTVGIQTPFVRSLMQQDQESSSLPISELLYRACIEGHIEKVQGLLARGAEVNASTANGTALWAACVGGHLDCASLVIAAGAQVNCMTPNDTTPFMAAAQAGQMGLVTMLLKQKDLQVNLQTSDGHTALYLASQRGHAKVVALLLAAGADPKLSICGMRHGQRAGWSPLHVASYYGLEPIVKLLLDTGKCEVDKTDDSGKQPVDLATHPPVIELLRTYELSVENPTVIRAPTPAFFDNEPTPASADMSAPQPTAEQPQREELDVSMTPQDVMSLCWGLPCSH